MGLESGSGLRVGDFVHRTLVREERDPGETSVWASRKIVAFLEGHASTNPVRSIGFIDGTSAEIRLAQGTIPVDFAGSEPRRLCRPCVQSRECTSRARRRRKREPQWRTGPPWQRFLSAVAAVIHGRLVVAVQVFWRAVCQGKSPPTKEGRKRWPLLNVVF